jgi:hypothetical protein
MSTAVGAFMDRERPPTEPELAAALGPAAGPWTDIAAWVVTTYGIAGEWDFSGKETGWAMRFRRSGRSLLWLFPRPGSVRALVVVGPAIYGEARSLGLAPATADALRDAHAYPDGRWLYVTADSEAVVADIRRLVALKSPPPRRPRRSSPA